MYTYMCTLVTMLYSRKLIEHCKPGIMGKKSLNIKKGGHPWVIIKTYYFSNYFLIFISLESNFITLYKGKVFKFLMEHSFVR